MLKSIQDLENLVNRLKEKYPEHRLSFGYIGNDSVRFGDDRLWCVFTRYYRVHEHAMPTSETLNIGNTATAQNPPEKLEEIIVKWVEGLGSRKDLTTRS